MSNDLVVSGSAPDAGGDFASGVGFGGSSGRRAQIEHILATDRDRYFREGLDQELAMLRAEEKAASDPDAAAVTGMQNLPVEVSMREFQQSVEGRELVSAWRGAPGGFAAVLARAQSGADVVLNQLGSIRNQAGFTERFNRNLTERARYHVYDEIAKGDTIMAEPASPGDVQEFAVTQAEKELVSEWGSRAGEKIGRVWARVHRFARAMDDEVDFASFAVWFTGLSKPEAKSVIRFLAR